MCELQPHGVPYACSPEQPVSRHFPSYKTPTPQANETVLNKCTKDGVYCFVDTYNYPEKGIISGCNGDWKPLAIRYQLELNKEWDERVLREQKEGNLSLIVERWLKENENRPDGEKRKVGERSKFGDGTARAVFYDKKDGDGEKKTDDEKKPNVVEKSEVVGKDDQKSEVIEMAASSEDDEKTKCTCGGNKSKCACEAGKCGCSKSATSDEKTKCNCGGDDSKCECEPGKCACPKSAANGEGDATTGEDDQKSSDSHLEL